MDKRNFNTQNECVHVVNKKEQDAIPAAAGRYYMKRRRLIWLCICLLWLLAAFMASILDILRTLGMKTIIGLTVMGTFGAICIVIGYFLNSK